MKRPRRPLYRYRAASNELEVVPYRGPGDRFFLTGYGMFSVPNPRPETLSVLHEIMERARTFVPPVRMDAKGHQREGPHPDDDAG